MENKFQEHWKNFLTPGILRQNLIFASVYIAAFEVLKNSIIERIRGFYIIGLDMDDQIGNKEYEKSVLSKDKSPVYASLKWLKEVNAISDDDINTFTQVKETRNYLAHEITKILDAGLPSDISKHFIDMISLVDKIEKWWIVNVDIPTNPDFAGKEDQIDEDEIFPGPSSGLRMMFNIALGSDETANHYINAFNELKGKN